MIHNFHLRRTPRGLSGIGMPKIHQTKKSEGLSYLNRIFYFYIVFNDYQKPFMGNTFHVNMSHACVTRDTYPTYTTYTFFSKIRSLLFCSQFFILFEG